ncbi:hypothetical protein OIDMADRAFT_183558 [Oidiodendron maius Zn]|uniref:Uncharacterized protein n=1 Tax=Oidiodendron maius (strain Zn) TaxID=913774 RepID=A0A0C3CB70_OIDMZ|nr:hypothetical protein OIDMADRAFT_183558 [Oidiodendron maius Zn]
MSNYPQFTPEEEAKFKNLEFRRSRADELYYFDRGVPTNERHKQWLEEQKRQKAEQEAGAAAQKYEQNTRQYPQMYANDGPADSSADPEYQNPDPSESATSVASYSESTCSEHGATDGQRNKQLNEIAAQKMVENGLRKFGNNLREIRMHSKRNGWKGLVATLDIGTEENWICKKKADQLNLKIKRGYSVKCVTFDGHTFSSGEVVEPTWVVEGQSKSYVTQFRVASKEAPFDVLFGRNILSTGEVDFDSEESPVQINVQKGVKACPDEKKTIDENEATHSVYRQNDASKPHPVKNNKSTKKQTPASPTKGPRDAEGKRK